MNVSRSSDPNMCKKKIFRIIINFKIFKFLKSLIEYICLLYLWSKFHCQWCLCERLSILIYIYIISLLFFLTEDTLFNIFCMVGSLDVWSIRFFDYIPRVCDHDIFGNDILFFENWFYSIYIKKWNLFHQDCI